jgi:hypothetical protein
MTLATYASRPPSVLARLDRLLALNESPPRSPAAAYAGLSCGSPQAEQEGMGLAEYLGRTLRGRQEDE